MLMDNVKQVFIVPYDKTTDISNGFTRQKHDASIWKKYNDIGKFIDIDVANDNMAMQQITPFTIIKRGNKYLTTVFNQNGFEKLSIGIGNNIETQDGVSSPLFNGAVRTLLESVNIDCLVPLIHVGTVRDKNKLPNYIGYVFVFNDIAESVVYKDKIAYKSGGYNYTNNVDNHDKDDISYEIKGEWLTIDELINKYGKLDTWTRHIVSYLVDSDF